MKAHPLQICPTAGGFLLILPAAGECGHVFLGQLLPLGARWMTTPDIVYLTWTLT